MEAPSKKQTRRHKVRPALSGAELSQLAHDLKNPLSGIRSATELVHSNLHEGDRNRAITAKIIEGIDALLLLIDERLPPK